MRARIRALFQGVGRSVRAALPSATDLHLYGGSLALAVGAGIQFGLGYGLMVGGLCVAALGAQVKWDVLDRLAGTLGGKR